MIISKTPLRISFFGGGTDYKNWYIKNGGEVISSTINKYIFVSCRQLLPFFDHNLRVSYSKIEEILNIKDLQHPVVKACLNLTKLKKNIADCKEKH